MFDSNHRVLLALSGGKDSFTLLDVMLEIHDPSKMGIVTIIEGIPGYNRRGDIEWIISKAGEFKVDLYLTSFKEYVGKTLAELVDLSRERGLGVSPCTFCGITRRRIINEYARMGGFDRVLTAHNLDDEAHTVLLNLFRGDLARLVQTHPLGPALSGKFVRKFKPLRKVYERESALYAYLRGHRFQEVECPYITTVPTLRAKIREYMHELEAKQPGVLLNLLERIDALVPKLLGRFRNLPELPTCVNCGEPTAYGRKYCRFCELINAVGIKLGRALG